MQVFFIETYILHRNIDHKQQRQWSTKPNEQNINATFILELDYVEFLDALPEPSLLIVLMWTEDSQGSESVFIQKLAKKCKSILRTISFLLCISKSCEINNFLWMPFFRFQLSDKMLQIVKRTSRFFKNDFASFLEKWVKVEFVEIWCSSILSWFIESVNNTWQVINSQEHFDKNVVKTK